MGRDGLWLFIAGSTRVSMFLLLPLAARVDREAREARR
jgi:hypothetical protein